MAKKVILRDQNDNKILPITRGELILDSSGMQAFHSNEFLATDSQPGLMSVEDKIKIKNLSGGVDFNNEFVTLATNQTITGIKTFTNQIKFSGEDYPHIAGNGNYLRFSYNGEDAKSLLLGKTDLATRDDNVLSLGNTDSRWSNIYTYSINIANSVLVNGKSLGDLAFKNSLSFSEITSKPTTLAGYGITDGMKVGGVYSANWNDNKSNGSYYVSSSSTNRPASFGQMLVMHNNDTTGQLYVGYNSGDNMYWRGLVDASASVMPWRKILDDSNFSSYALPLSGGTMTGDIVLPDNKFIRHNASNGYALLGVLENEVLVGATINPLRLRSNGVSTINGNTFIHSGNIGSYALTTGGGQMDRNTGITWDNGYYDSDAVGSHLSVLADTTQDNSLATQTGYSYNAVLNVGGGGVDSYRFQMASYAASDNFLFYRGYDANAKQWKNWVQILHTGNSYTASQIDEKIAALSGGNAFTGGSVVSSIYPSTSGGAELGVNGSWWGNLYVARGMYLKGTGSGTSGLFINGLITTGGYSTDLWLYNSDRLMLYGSNIKLNSETEVLGSFSATGNISAQGVGSFVNGLTVGGNDVIHQGNIGNQRVWRADRAENLIYSDSTIGLTVLSGGKIKASNQITFDDAAAYGIYRGNYFTGDCTAQDIIINAPKLLMGISGNVLIGTTTDNGYKLYVNGSSYVNGELNVVGRSVFSSAMTCESNLYVNKSLTVSGQVIATTFIGNIDGQYVNKLTGYAIATSASNLSTTDTLNSALGKLEYKVNSTYNWYQSVTGTDTDNVINKWHEIVDFVNNITTNTDLTDEFVTRKTAQTISGKKTFSNGLAITGGSENTAMPFFLGIDAFADGGTVRWIHANKVAAAIGALTQHQSLTNYVTLNTNQTITGAKNFSNDLALIANNENRYITFYHTGGTGYDWRIGYLGSGNDDANYFVIQSDKTDGTYVNALRIGLTTLASVFGGTVTASKFITSGGKSTQFVKGDGSLDSNTYATTTQLGQYLPLTGGTMNSDANISWKDRGAWGNSSAEYPYEYGGLKWSGTSDSVKIFARENSSDSLDLIIKFGDDTGHKIILSDNGVEHNIIHSGNYTSYVNTTNFPGLNSIGDITGVTAGAGLGGGGTFGSVTLTNAGVRATTINGNYLRVNTNGTNVDLTIPYATLAAAVACSAGSSDVDRPIVVTNTSNVLYYSAKATINYTTGNITAGKFTGNLNNTLTFSAGAFSAKTYNNSAAVTVNIPTHTSHLTNNSGFLTSLPSHTHNYLTAYGEAGIASVRTADHTRALCTGGWSGTDKGYGSQYGTTLDVSGYSTWYHRLAFRTDGKIEYWQGINTKTLTKQGILAFTSDITKSTVGLGNVQNTAFYQRVTTVNGTAWDMAGTNGNAAFTIYAPTTAGTSGQVLISSGGTPSWANQSSLSVGYASSAGNADTVDNKHASDFKSVNVNNYSYTPNLAFYDGGSASTNYYKLSITNVNNVWTMLYVEMSIKENYSYGNYGKIILHINKNSSNTITAFTIHTLGQLSSSVKAYASNNSSSFDIYIAGNWSYPTLNVDRLTFGDLAATAIGKNITLTKVTELPSSYSTASVITGIHSGNYNSYALPLSGGTMSGNITFNSGQGIYNTSGGMLSYVSSTGNGWTGASDLSNYVVVGTVSCGNVIRTSGDNLYHYNNSDGSRYKILDSGNSSIGDYNVKINGTTKQFVRDWGHGAPNMNDVATGGRSSMGMANLSTPSGGTATYVNPGGVTDWHHFINIAYTGGEGGSNSWVTQIANKAGTTDLWIRSRSGGTISNTTAWTAPWTRVLTGSNYSNVLNSVYAPKTITDNLTNFNVGLTQGYINTFKSDSISLSNTSAQITRTGADASWYTGRKYAVLKTTSYTGYGPVISMKTSTGDWSLGVYLDDYAYLTFITDTNYNNSTNSATYQLKFPKATGTLATTSDLSSYLPLSGGTMTGPIRSDSGYVILNPISASYHTMTSAVSGCITINLPASLGNTMVSMWIDVYVYETQKSFSIHCGGYTYNNSTWSNSPFAIVYGANHRVRLGHNGTQFVVYIGETNTAWSYPQVSVRNVTLGYSPTLANWAKAWSISFSTSVNNVTYDTTTYAWTTKNLSKSEFAAASHRHTKLYRRDDSSDYSVQHHWTGTYWYLRGYSGDSYHAGVQVDYANNAGTANSVAWTNVTGKPSSYYSLPLAASGTRGGIQIGYTDSGANIALKLSSEKGYVTLTKTAVTTALGYTPPSSDTNTWRPLSFNSTSYSGSGVNFTGGTGISLSVGAADSGGQSTVTISPLLPKSGSWFNDGLVKVSTSGVAEIGRYIDFHPTNTSTLDYSVRIDSGTSTTARTFTLGTTGGTLAITADNNKTGNTTTTSKIYPVGTTSTSTTAGNYAQTYTNTNFYVNSSGVFWTSDRKFKDCIKSPVKNGMLDDETGLIRKFNWKDTGKSSYGFIAQELLPYVPEAVDYDEELNKYSVNYDVAHSALIAQLIIKVKELEEEILRLKQLIN